MMAWRWTTMDLDGFSRILENTAFFLLVLSSTGNLHFRSLKTHRQSADFKKKQRGDCALVGIKKVWLNWSSGERGSIYSYPRFQEGKTLELSKLSLLTSEIKPSSRPCVKTLLHRKHKSLVWNNSWLITFWNWFRKVCWSVRFVCLFFPPKRFWCSSETVKFWDF